MSKKVALHNLGCKVNAYEVEAMQQLLEKAGYEIVPFEEGADIYLINTCTVTNIADRKSRQMLHKAKKMNPDAIVIAAGCYVQTDEGKLDKDEAVDLILGNNQKGNIVQVLEEYEQQHIRQKHVLKINQTKEYEELAKKVMAICAEYKVPCILHTFWRVAEKLKCDTVHLPLPILRQFVLEKQNQKNQKYRESQNLSIPESQREIIRKIGTSVHSTEQAQEAQELGASYVTAGHIYATDCKKGLQPRGLDFLRQVCAAVDLPVYAIGGIKFDETQWMSLKECGAAGGCIMSGMMKA